MIFDTLDVKYLKRQLDRLSNLNITLTDLRDAISGGKSLADVHSALYSATDGKSVYDRLVEVVNKLDVALSSRASETTLAGIKAKIDKLTFDSSNNLLVYIQGGTTDIGNFPAWFTNSTKKIDDLFSKLDALDNALASVGTDKFRTSLVDALPTGDNWIGKVKIGDGTKIAGLVSATLAGVSLNALAVAPDLVKAVSGGSNYVYEEIATSTTEVSSSFSPPIKFAVLSNRDTDNDVLVRFNSATAAQIRIPAGTAKVVMFPISTLYYVATNGTPTLVVIGFQ